MELNKGKYLSFLLKDEIYGVELLKVKEIIGAVEISHIPGMPDYVKGVINLRGKIIPILDLRLRFGFEQKEYDDRTCIIIVEITKNDEIHLCGFVTDTVKEVLNIKEENISPPPEYATVIGIEFLDGIGNSNGDLIRLLNADKIIYKEHETEVLELNTNNIN